MPRRPALSAKAWRPQQAQAPSLASAMRVSGAKVWPRSVERARKTPRFSSPAGLEESAACQRMAMRLVGWRLGLSDLGGGAVFWGGPSEGFEEPARSGWPPRTAMEQPPSRYQEECMMFCWSVNL